MGRIFYSVYEKVKKIPRGKVTTYGEIARAIGNPHLSRRVGYALHANPEPITTPCHRVVNRFGSLAPSFAFGGLNVQKDLLMSEGVEVSDDGFVDLDKYMYYFDK